MFRSTLAAAALALFAIAGTASAQSTPSAAASQHRFRRGDLFDGINLTAAQKSQIEAIRAKYHPGLEAARDSIKPDWAALKNARTAKDSAAIRAARQDIRGDRKERGEILKDEHDELLKVLGPEQREKFEKNLKEWNADRRDRRRRSPRDGRRRTRDSQRQKRSRRRQTRDRQRQEGRREGRAEVRSQRSEERSERSEKGS